MGTPRTATLLLVLVLAVPPLATSSSSSPCPRCEFVRHDASARELLEASRPLHATLRVETPTPIDHLSSLSLLYDIPRSNGSTASLHQDWIGVYCVDDERRPNRDEDFLDVLHLNPQAASAGRITIDRIANMRCLWQFRLFRLLQNKHYLLAHTPYVRMKYGVEEPLHVHLALTGNATEMRVMWVSGRVFEPRVVYGPEPDKMTSTAKASVSSYAASDMCQEPATTVHSQFFREPGQLHDAVLTGLEPGKTYYYQVVGDTLGISTRRVPSKIFRFKATRRAGERQVEDSRSQSFFVYGDMGDWDIRPVGLLPGNRTATTVELMREDMDTERDQHLWLMVLHDGDISYAKGRTYLWDQFGSIIEPVAAELPYMVGVGNHDYCYHSGGEGKDPSGAGPTGFHPPNAPNDCSSGGECGVPLHKRFKMPGNGNDLFWYSFRVGLSHHIMLSSEHDFTTGAPMHNWFLNDLMNVNRTQTPWLFVHIHRPMYCSEQYESDFQLSLMIRKHLEPLCAAFGVDVVFSGHYHAYERTCPVFQEECRSRVDVNGVEWARAPIHIMVGSAGASLDNAAYFAVPWSRRAMQEYGYGRMHVYNATHALYEFKSNQERRVVDFAWIVSDHEWHKDVLVVDRRVYGQKPQPAQTELPSIDRHEALERQRAMDQAIIGLHVETPEDLVAPEIEAINFDRPPSDEVLRESERSAPVRDQTSDEANEDW